MRRRQRLWLPRVPVLPRIGRDEMRHAWRTLAHVKGIGLVPDLTIPHSHALMLTEVLRPGFDNERLNVAIKMSRITEQPPPHGAVTAADHTQGPHGPGKCARLFWGNGVFEQYQHRAIVWACLADNHWVVSMQRLRHIQSIRWLQAIPPQRDETHDEPARGTQEGDRDAGVAGDTPPHRTPHGQPSLDDQRIDAQGPRTHPRGHRGLYGHRKG